MACDGDFRKGYVGATLTAFLLAWVTGLKTLIFSARRAQTLLTVATEKAMMTGAAWG